MQQSSRKKVLMFTDWYEPGYKAGGPIQACKNIVSTVKEVCDFYILCADRDLGETAPYAGIPVNQWIKKESGVSIWYAAPGALVKQQLIKILDELKPDIVYLNSMFSYSYTLFPLRVLLKNHFPGKIILAPRGMLHKGALKIKYVKKNVFLKLFRMIGWSRKIVFQATDEQERKDIQLFFTDQVNVEVVEDIPTQNEAAWQEKKKEAGVLKCVFLSRIHPKKNLHYFLQLLKEVDQQLEIHFDVYGTDDDPEYVAQCKTIAATLPQNIQVRFLQAIPFNQVFVTLSHYHVFILTTLGENYGHAIFEALTTGLPVMISDQTPWRNLEEKKSGWDIPLREKGKFIIALEQATGWNQEQYNEWSSSAYHYAREYMQQLDALSKYQKLFSGGKESDHVIY